MRSTKIFTRLTGEAVLRAGAAIAVGAVGFAIASAIGSSVVQRLTAAVFLGAAAPVILLLVDLERRLSAVDEAAKLLAQADAKGFESDELGQLIRELADLSGTWTAIRSCSPPPR